MSSGEGRRLTPKQQRFAEEYVVDCNGKQAAIRSGYSEKTAEFQASRLLSNDKVASEIKSLLEKKEKKTGADAEWITARLMREAEYDGEGSSHAARVSALATLSKNAGMQTDRLKVEIEHNWNDQEAAERLVLIFQQIDRAKQVIDADFSQQGKDSRLLEPGESPAESPDNRDSEEVEASSLDTIPRPADSSLL